MKNGSLNLPSVDEVKATPASPTLATLYAQFPVLEWVRDNCFIGPWYFFPKGCHRGGIYLSGKGNVPLEEIHPFNRKEGGYFNSLGLGGREKIFSSSLILSAGATTWSTVQLSRKQIIWIQGRTIARNLRVLATQFFAISYFGSKIIFPGEFDVFIDPLDPECEKTIKPGPSLEYSLSRIEGVTPLEDISCIIMAEFRIQYEFTNPEKWDKEAFRSALILTAFRPPKNLNWLNPN